MPTQLSPFDATFLELEQSDESAHMHIGGVLVFEPRADGQPPRLEEVRSRLLERLGALPRYRQRLSSTRAAGLSWPRWEPDPSFDIEHHVRRAALPAPGCQAELEAWAGQFWSQRLDRRRPLWEAVLLEGLAGDRWALATKTHHCMVDGVGSVDLVSLVLSPSPDPDFVAPLPTLPEEPDDGIGGLLGFLRSLPGTALSTTRAGVDAVLNPSQLREVFDRSRALAELIVRDEIIPAPQTSLNQPMGTRRRFAVARTSLEEVRAIRESLGGTVNDVVLALTTGGLRRLLLARGDDPPPQGLRAMVPMNLRSAAESLGLGNRVTSLFVHLPVADSEPLERFQHVCAETTALKSGSQAVGSATALELAGIAPPVLHAFLARALYATRLFNLTVTSVPGPQIPLYAWGSLLREIWPLVPLAAQHTLGIAVFSYAGRIVFGAHADRDSVPDVAVLAGGIEATRDELLRIARGDRPASDAAPLRVRVRRREA